jgi:5-hydroxyisourate hydrolase-like protein (transthyretin family)
METMNFQATGNLSETKTGEPLQGVTVTIPITNPDGSAGPILTAVTDQDGNYSVSQAAPDPLPEGDYTADATSPATNADQAADSGPVVAEVGPAATTLTLNFNVAAAPAPAPAQVKKDNKIKYV